MKCELCENGKVMEKVNQALTLRGIEPMNANSCARCNGQREYSSLFRVKNNNQKIPDDIKTRVKVTGKHKGKWGRYAAEAINEMRELYATGQFTQEQLAGKFGCSHVYACQLLKGVKKGTK